MPEYRVVVADLSSNFLEEVPASNLQYSYTLNAPGAISFRMELKHPKATSTLLAPGERELHVLRDGTKVWGGYLWAAPPTLGELAVVGAGWLSRLGRRIIDVTQTFTALEQFDIAWNLINFTQSKTSGNLGITRGTEVASGVIRDRTYNAFERKNIREALEQLAAVDRGFDFEITPAKVWRVYYPSKGVALSEAFEYGKNIGGLSYPNSAEDVVSELTALGAGEGTAVLTSVKSDTTALTKFGLLQDTVAFKDVSVQVTLDDHAAEELRRRKLVRTQPTIDVTVNDPPFGSFAVGDTIRVVAKEGYIQLDDTFRIVTITVGVSDEGRDAVGITFDRRLT